MFPTLREPKIFAAFEPASRVSAAYHRLNGAGGFGNLSVWQDEQSFHVDVDLPGVAESDVEITLHQGTLLIQGARKKDDGRRYLYNSRAFGRFERSITLPEDIATDGIQAILSDGVLKLTLPRRPEAQPKRITVQPS